MLTRSFSESAFERDVEGREPVLLVIDSHPTLHQLYHIKSDGPDVVERFLTKIDRIRDELLYRLKQPLICICSFDNGGKTFRHDICEIYKADREPNEDTEPIREVIEHAKEAIEYSCHWNAEMAFEGYESDDMLASYAKQYDGKVVLHSIDKDIFQCLDPGRVTICRRSNIEEGRLVAQWMTSDTFRNDFGFSHKRWVEYQCLIGDSADNIPGAKGIGPKTGKSLIAKFDDPVDQWDLDEMVFEGDMTPAKARAIKEIQDDIVTWRKVFTLEDSLPVEIRL